MSAVFGFVANILVVGIVLFLPHFAVAQTILDIAKVCTTPTQSILEITENLESVGLYSSAETDEPATATQYFAAAAVALNVTSKTEDFDWLGQLNIEAKRLQRTLDRGDTNFKQIRYFAPMSDPTNVILLVLRTSIPNIRLMNECHFVGASDYWTKESRDELLATAQSSFSHDDGFQSGILVWGIEEGTDYEQFVTISFFKPKLFDLSLESEEGSAVTLFSMYAYSRQSNKTPNQNEVQQ